MHEEVNLLDYHEYQLSNKEMNNEERQERTNREAEVEVQWKQCRIWIVVIIF